MTTKTNQQPSDLDVLLAEPDIETKQPETVEKPEPGKKTRVHKPVEAAAPPRVKPAPIHQRNIHRFVQHGTNWHATVGLDVTLEDILTPDFWTHVCGSTFTGLYNEITVQWEDSSKLAKLFVRQYDKNFAKVELLSFHDFGGADVKVPNGYHVLWGGIKEKYRVVRASDSRLMRNQINSREEAVAYIEANLKDVK